MDKSTKKKLPKGWVMKNSSRHPNRVFYFNVTTGESSWDFPGKKSKHNIKKSAKSHTLNGDVKLSKSKTESASLHKKLKNSKELTKQLMDELQKAKNEAKLSSDFAEDENTNSKRTSEMSNTFQKVTVKTLSKDKKFHKKNKRNLQNCKSDSNVILSTVINNEKTVTNNRNIETKGLITLEEKYSSTNTSVHFTDFDKKESVDVEMIDLSNFLNSETIQPMQTEEVLFNHDLFIVVDTNIFLCSLKYIKCLTELQSTEFGTPIIIIPWVVIQELDSLKSNRNSKASHKAAEAVQFVFKKLKSGHPRIRGQTAKEASLCEYDNLNAECNDDKILQCCLRLYQKAGKDHVILMTEDKNLSNKAIINDIVVQTGPDLAKYLKFNIAQISNSKTTQNKTTQDLSVENQIEQRKKEIGEIMIDVQSITKHTLASIIESEMKGIFGDIWMRILIVKPPWTLLDTLKCIKSHWIAVFGFLFPQEMKKTVETLSSILKKGFCNIEDENEILSVFELSSTICLNVHLKFDTTDTDGALSKLRELKTKWLSFSQKSTTSQNLSIDAEDHKAVLAMFDYVWDCINYTCGMFSDVLNYPDHGIIYAKPQMFPSAKHVCSLLPIVNDKIRALSEKMRILISSNDLIETGIKKLISEMRNALYSYTEGIDLEFPSSSPKVGFNNYVLEQFFLNPENKQLLENGCQQLLQFHSKLSALLQHYL